MNKSLHAQTRCQQRGISNRQIELLLKYGVLKQKNGAFECFISKRQCDEIKSQFKHDLQDLDNIARSNKTLLLDEGSIITAYNKHLK